MESAWEGFARDTFEFLSDLHKNNEKEWFEVNRSRYNSDWLIPAQEFVTAMAPVVETLSPPHQAVPKINKSIRRINRDTRFSADKTPYSPQMHIVFWCGDHPNRSPALHFVVSTEGLGYGAGQWAMTPDQLARYRAALADEKSAAALSKALEQAGKTNCTLTEETLKKLPAGAPEGTGMDTLFKRKGLVVRTHDETIAVGDAVGSNGLERARDIAHTLVPINRWLMDNVA